MIGIFEVLIGLFMFTLFVTPIILLTILVVRTSKKPPTINKDRIDALEQNDNIIVEDVNAALVELMSKITELEERLDREDSTVKGFGNKK